MMDMTGSPQDYYVSLFTVIADILISVAYFAIPVEMWFFQRNLPGPVPHQYILILYQMFILACGVTHLTAVWAPWTQTAVAQLVVKLVCAALSVGTAVIMVKVIPMAFSLPVKAEMLARELGARIRHGHHLQATNELLVKFRKMTHNIRKTLDVSTICDTAVYELCNALTVSGVAVFFPEDGRYRCTAEYIKHKSENPSTSPLSPTLVKTHYWKTITVPSDCETLRRMDGVTCASHISHSEISSMVAKQRGVLYSSGMIMAFALPNTDQRGLVLAFNEKDQWCPSQEDFELFEDIVSQVQIALEQAYQIRQETKRNDQFNNQVQKNDELSKAKRNAEMANEIKSQLLSTLNKEFGGPIIQIKLLCQQIANTDLEAGQVKYIESILNYNQTLSDVLNEANDFVHAEAGDLTLNQYTFNLKDTFSTVIPNIENLCENKQVEFTWRIDSLVPSHWMGDNLRLRKMLLNMATNSLQFTHQGRLDMVVSLEDIPPSEWMLSNMDLKSTSSWSHYTHPFPPTLTKDSLPASSKDVQDSLIPLKLYVHIKNTGKNILDKSLDQMFRSLALGDPIINHPTNAKLSLNLTTLCQLVKLMGGSISVWTHGMEGTIFSYGLTLCMTSPKTPKS
jgi:signal transduction histidine kinase